MLFLRKIAIFALRITGRRVGDGPGEMPEWSIGPHSKCGVRATVPGVRIPLSPQRINRSDGWFFFLIRGKVQEWLNWPAWKASKPLKGFRGSNPLLSAACENRVASDLAARFLLRFRVSRRGFSGRGAPSLFRARRRALPRRLRSASTRRSACGHAGGRTRAGWRRAVSARSGCTAAV